ncbi:Hypothetical predicted protein [Mytilus galloprovincialis]|uniref:Homeobox domain-containing protein n=1 Tax=Mytilus galloprovincialis TaxID=29158 RepID=A0A8B6E9N2_MYTGA|nr:Hypothetical predicted protein [Mytilus galloprovincialis]
MSSRSVPHGSTRTRQDFSKIQIEKLEDAWQKGLTSTSKDHAAEIDVLSNETSISRERIEVWIGNRRAKQKRGGQGVRPTKKRKTVKAPTAYSLFSQQFKRGKYRIVKIVKTCDTPKEEHLRSLGEKWGRTSEEEKMEFRIQAKEIRDDPLKGRTAEEIAECAVLQSLGYEIAAIAAKESEPSQLFGTPRGLEFVNKLVKGMQFQKGFRESVFRHIVYVGDDSTHKDTKKRAN